MARQNEFSTVVDVDNDDNIVMTKVVSINSIYMVIIIMKYRF